MLCECPIGTTYFFKFLQQEFNSENLQAYIDTKKFRDLVEKEKVIIPELIVSFTTFTISNRKKKNFTILTTWIQTHTWKLTSLALLNLNL
jgi:hypothetical protein